MRTISGWSGEWGLPREQATAIVAGSAFVLEAAATDDFWGGLEKLSKDGIGERRHEGFGWVAVDPGWLGTQEVEPDEEVETRHSLPGSVPWPDLPKGLRHKQKMILEKANALKGQIKGGTAKKIQDLAHHAARSQSTADVISFVRGMGMRGNPRDWDVVLRIVEGPLGEMPEVAAARLFLTALAAMTATERGEE